MSGDANRISRATALLSGAFALGLASVAYLFHSQLAWAQAADSVLDFASALTLAWVVRIGQQPRDEGHPWGHSRAEPLGALVVAMLAGVLAVEVASGAAQSLASGVRVVPSIMLLGLFLSKVAFKAFVFAICRRANSPALRALAVDARNDVLVGLLSVVGYLCVVAGYERWDSLLAFPVALWIGWSGVQLARENIDLLMGSAPPQARRAALLHIVRSIPGVLDASDLRAQHLGAELSVHVCVSVRPDLTVAQAHDIGELVREALESEADVAHGSVHLRPGANGA